MIKLYQGDKEVEVKIKKSRVLSELVEMTGK